jgi:hypothetical protein
MRTALSSIASEGKLGEVIELYPQDEDTKAPEVDHPPLVSG